LISKEKTIKDLIFQNTEPLNFFSIENDIFTNTRPQPPKSAKIRNHRIKMTSVIPTNEP
jgi:hypothetical protein